MLCCSTGLNLEQLGSNKFNLGRIFLIIRVDPNTGSRSKGSQEGPWGSEKEQEKGHTQSTAHFLHFTDQLFWVRFQSKMKPRTTGWDELFGLLQI